MWLPAYLADVESDLSAFHGVRDIGELGGPEFFALAWRTPHYRGVMRDRVLALQREQEEAPAPSAQPRRTRAPAGERAEPVTEAVLADPVMSKIFGFS